MKPHVRWIVALVILSLSAFLMVSCPDPDKEARRVASVRTRWIGLTKPGSLGCPAQTPGWKQSLLFPLDGLSPDLQQSARKAGLDRFCVYEYKGLAPYPELPQEIAEQLLSAETDKVAMTSAADPDALTEMTWSPFHDRFSNSVEIPEGLPAFTGSPTRLAVLDTQPKGEKVPEEKGNSDHGYTLMHIAGDLACKPPGVSCPVQIASRLAMPVLAFDQGKETVDKKGGFHGTFASLSQALWDEIKQPRPDHNHLVLNLSLGWDEKFGGGEKDPADMPPGVQAVYRALEVASDQGILVIAAAGNELSGLYPTEQPLLPAGWESRQRPAGKGPLVYAASGVDGQDHPLVSTRTHGEASLVVYADHVVVPDPYDSKGHTATLTGTSVAAVVVSTTAALVWSYHHEMTPAEVMNTLAQSKDLGRKPDFSFPSGSASGSVHRVSLCQALQACVPVKASCRGAVPCGPLPPPLEPVMSPFQPKMRIKAMTSSFGLSTQKFPNLLDQPWVGPQPGADPCPSCAVTGPPDRAAALRLAASPGGAAATARAAFKSSSDSAPVTPEPTYKLRVEIPGTWAPGELRDATLEIFNFDSRGRKQHMDEYSFGPPLHSGETLEGEIQTDTPIQARLIFTLAPPKGSPPGTGPMSVDSPLFVEYRPPSR